jgi:amino acid transporter
MFKKLSLVESTLIGVAGNAPAYGVGVATATLIAAASDSGPLAVLICGFLMLGILVAYQKLNEEDPNCGAAYAWVARLMHPRAGFLAGWCLLVALEIFMVSAMLAAGQIVVNLIGLDPALNKPLIYLIGLAFLVTVTIPALLGASVFGKFQSFFTAVELVLVAVVAGVAYVSFPGSVVNKLSDFLPFASTFGIGSIAKGVVVAVFFFWGWDVIFNLNEETSETRRNSAIAGRNTMAILIAIYVGFAVLASSMLTSEDMKMADQNLLLAIANKIFPEPFGSIAVIAFLISILGSLDASLIQFSRTLLSTSRDGVITKSLSHTSESFGVPVYAILMSVSIAVLLSVMSFASGTVNDSIAAGVAGSAIFVACYYGLAGIACAMFFLRRGSARRFDALVYVVWPVGSSIALVACAIFAASDFGPLTSSILVGAFSIGLGVAFALLPAKSSAT